MRRWCKATRSRGRTIRTRSDLRGFARMRWKMRGKGTSRHVAAQWELPLIDERARDQVTPPPRGSLLRIAGAPTDINGVWKVKSALRLPGNGIFLGLEPPVVVTARQEPRPT